MTATVKVWKTITEIDGETEGYALCRGWDSRIFLMPVDQAKKHAADITDYYPVPEPPVREKIIAEMKTHESDDDPEKTD